MAARTLKVVRGEIELFTCSLNEDDVPEVLAYPRVGNDDGDTIVDYEIALGPLSEAAAQGDAVATPRAMPAHAELFVDKAGDARFRIVAGNGEIVGASQAYHGRWGKRNARKTAERFGLSVVEA